MSGSLMALYLQRRKAKEAQNDADRRMRVVQHAQVHVQEVGRTHRIMAQAALDRGDLDLASQAVFLARAAEMAGAELRFEELQRSLK